MRILLLIFTLSMIWSCSDDDLQERRQAMIDVEVQKKLDRYEKIILDRCYEKVKKEAEMYVDSIVTAEISFTDTLYVPHKPSRPQSPDRIILNDSVNASPLFDE